MSGEDRPHPGADILIRGEHRVIRDEDVLCRDEDILIQEDDGLIAGKDVLSRGGDAVTSKEDRVIAVRTCCRGARIDSSWKRTASSERRPSAQGAARLTSRSPPTS